MIYKKRGKVICLPMPLNNFGHKMVTPFRTLPLTLTPCLIIWAILESLRHFIPQDKLTLILFTDNTSVTPCLSSKEKKR